MMTAQKFGLMPFDTSSLRGLWKFDEPMSKHTSWRVGGPAQYFYLPADRDDVVELMKLMPAAMPVYWIGLGSNLLVRDGGVAGVVIKTSKALATIEIQQQTNIYAESGVACAKVARACVANGLTGAEFLAGVPGSFGGALAMNAGAFGGQTWALVKNIECVDRAGVCRQFAQSEIAFDYRRVKLPPGSAVLGGVLGLQKADQAANGKQIIRGFLEQRSASQPLQSANAGSTFKNPQGRFAAKIIEQLGLMGHRIGDACFSEVHANFIVNQGNATAADIEALMQLAIRQARELESVALEAEVQIIGAPA